MLDKNANWIAVIAKYELTRRGISDVLANAGFEDVRDFQSHLELGEYLADHCHPKLLLLDTDKDYIAATAQIRKLGKMLEFTNRVALADDQSQIWVRLCRDHDFSLLLRKHVSPGSFIQILRRVMAGERVLPKGHAPDLATASLHDRSKPQIDFVKQPPKQNHQSNGIPCLVCRKHFETTDRRANRICPKCKSKSSWRYGTAEHVIQY
jgi:DNA-binding NarL/FixJ family response regulator